MDHSILSKFKTVTLQDITEFGLMDRVETKYVMHKKDLISFISTLPPNLNLLTFNTDPVSIYKTEYYDTEHNSMYLDHHRGKLNRYKVRVRSYENTRTAYMEIKFKNNKGKTLKTRTDINFDNTHLMNDNLIEFVEKNSPYDLNLLKPYITTNYNRTTFIDMQNQIRLTLDTQLSFEDADKSQTFENLCILEIKKTSAEQTYIERTMHQLGYKEFSISKYCLAMASLKNLKKNRFKSKINRLNKILLL